MTDDSGEVFRVERWGAICVIHFEVEALLDPLDVERVGVAMEEAFETGENPRLLLDLGPLAFISSLMISNFIRAQQAAEQHRGRLVLARMSDRLKKLLEGVKMDRFFETEDSVEAAVKALEAPADA